MRYLVPLLLICAPCRAGAPACVDARRDGDAGPCLIVSEREARSAVQCLRIDLPECEARAETALAVAEAELQAARDDAATQHARAEKLSKLLTAATAPREQSSTWRMVAAVAGYSIAAIGAVITGVEHDRPEVAAPIGIMAGAGLVLGIIATIDP